MGIECDIRDRSTVGKIKVGGVEIFGGGFSKRGVRPNPPNPPGYGPEKLNDGGFPTDDTRRRAR